MCISQTTNIFFSLALKYWQAGSWVSCMNMNKLFVSPIVSLARYYGEHASVSMFKSIYTEVVHNILHTIINVVLCFLKCLYNIGK